MIVITSEDNICRLTMAPTCDPSRSAGFEVGAWADIGHGRFDAVNRDVNFLNIDAFVDEFDKFIMERSRVPCLKGTYDTYIRFVGSGTAVHCEYRLGDAYCGQGAAEFYQSGRFRVENDGLLELLQRFRQVLAEHT